MIAREFIEKKEESKITTFPASHTQENTFLNTTMKTSQDLALKRKKLPIFQPKPKLTARPHEAISVCLKNLHVI